MEPKLLIRVFDVGLGDCIYCRIPQAIKIGGALQDFHMLIDCGTWSELALIEQAPKDLAGMLPDAGGGKKRLDLLVITHEHKDHIAGLDPELFAPFKIGAIWMNAAMDDTHPQSQKTRKLHAVAARAMRSLAAEGLALSPEAQELAGLFSIDNAGAMQAVKQQLPQANGITPKFVHAGQSNDDLELPLTGATIHVLGPEFDIDRFYLGKTSSAAQALALQPDPDPGVAAPAPPAADAPTPANISGADFRQLRSRMLSSALAFAALSSRVTNNSSVVLLVEWRGKRALFVGDAEWDAKFKEGKANGAWNVMWNERKDLLGKPIHFLKVGHHGSENATPWDETGDLTEPAAILEAILPMPSPGRTPEAFAAVSTARGKYPTIPRAELLTRIGARIANATGYAARFEEANATPEDLRLFDDKEKTWFAKAQPPRTDFERILTGHNRIDVELGGT